MLLDIGMVDVDSKDIEHGVGPLLYAAGNEKEAVVKILLDTSKVDIDSKDNYNQTSLSSAAWNGHEAVVRVLLGTGKVDLDSKDHDGRTRDRC